MIGLRAIVAAVAIFTSAAALAEPSGLDAKCKKIYNSYARKAGPKAFAISQNGYCGWAWRKTSSDAEFAAAKMKAIGFCMQAAGADCWVVESVR